MQNYVGKKAKEKKTGRDLLLPLLAACKDSVLQEPAPPSIPYLAGRRRMLAKQQEENEFFVFVCVCVCPRR